jgi:hypothetical protein
LQLRSQAAELRQDSHKGVKLLIINRLEWLRAVVSDYGRLYETAVSVSS